MMIENKLCTSNLKLIFSRLLGCCVTCLEMIGEGRNSKVYKLTCENSTHYTAKLYFLHSLDERSRLAVEYSSQKFLWENGVKCIPRPIAEDRNGGYAVYEYIDGNIISSKEVTNSDIDIAVEFLATLKELTTREGSYSLPSASEACFSVQAIVNNIEQRLSKLRTLSKGEGKHKGLDEFLNNELIPSFNEVIRWCKSSLKRSGMSFISVLSHEERTLSPSDFGFHNTLRKSNGQIVFLDFEHFGWDDPAKMISDFLLHPAMKLPESLKHRFVINILSCFNDRGNLTKRFEIVYPLFGIKWCMILLNEFLPEHLLRRRFAGGSDLNEIDLQAKQLSKAKRMLQKIRKDYERFPYGN